MRRCLGLLVCSIALVGMRDAALGAATEGMVILPSYLHDGPGKQYRVEDELSAGAAVTVLDCAKNWCQVESGRRRGFLPEDIVARNPAVSPQVTAQARSLRCFDVLRPGYAHGRLFVICPK